MKNKPFFWVGIGLSPFVLGFWWLLQNKPEPLNSDPLPQKSLLSIDFIPTKQKNKLPEKEFLLLSLDPSQPTTKKKLADFPGKPIIVHFWATWCGACVDEIPELDKFADKYGDNFHLIIISADEVNGKAVREFYNKRQIKNLSLYIDEKGALARALKVSALPTSVFISSKGLEQGRVIGPVEWVGGAGQLINDQLGKSK